MVYFEMLHPALTFIVNCSFDLGVVCRLINQHPMYSALLLFVRFSIVFASFHANWHGSGNYFFFISPYKEDILQGSRGRTTEVGGKIGGRSF